MTMAGGTNSQSLRISLEVDNESALPKLLEGRTIAILGNPLDNHTSEAREQSRRLQIHEQVQRARQLRASLEEAADLADALPDNSPSSYAEAMSILQSSLPQINQLVRLTEAIRGKQTIEDPDEYDKWNDWMKNRNEIEEAQQMREQRTLRRQLRDFAREKNPDLEIDELLEARHDSLIPKPKINDVPIESEEVNDEDEWKMGADEEDSMDDVLLEDYEPEDGNDDGEFIPQASQLEVESESDSDVLVPKQRTGRRKYNQRAKQVKATVPPSNAQTVHQPDTNEVWAKRQAMAISQEISELPPLTHRLFPQASPSAKKKSKVTTERKRDSGTLSDAPKAAKTRKKTPETLVAASSNNMRKAPPEIMPAFDTFAAVAEARAKAAAFASANHATKAAAAPPEPVAKAPAKRPAKPTSKARPPAKPVNKARPSKKCHDCKNTSTRYRNCSFWKLTGKCKKSFCIDCLSSKYSLGDDVKSSTNENGVPLEEIIMCAALDAEWHCPSCLGTCMCHLCVRDRKREEEREKSRKEAERKSSRRSAGSNYSYFF